MKITARKINFGKEMRFFCILGEERRYKTQRYYKKTIKEFEKLYSMPMTCRPSMDVTE